MTLKSSPLRLMHILILRSSTLSMSQADAWHTTSRSAGFTNRLRSQNVAGNCSKPSEEKNCSPARTISVSLRPLRSEEHTSELQSLMRISYAVFCLKKKKQKEQIITKI